MKFEKLLEKAQELGCGYVVSGHYSRIRRDDSTGRYLLSKAADKSKDQSYVLYSLTQQQLSHLLLPLGEMSKDEVRAIAESQGFTNAHKKDSQDICFIPDGDYAAFMERFTGKNYSGGEYLDLTGKVVGRHQGAVRYTIGQRKGLNLAMGRPVYVCSKDMSANTVTVGDDKDLYRTGLIAGDANFLPFDELTAPIEVLAKARYRMVEQPATVTPLPDGKIRVDFQESQRALTPGQAVVFYDGDLVVGGATIEKVL
jgi:tRNA-specific 2-thiouridylase